MPAAIPKYIVPPPLPPLVALILILALHRFLPVPFLSPAVSLAVGLPLFALGVVLWLWGVIRLVRRGETPNPNVETGRLVTDGPYRISRNPIYAGGTLGLLGLALWLNTATGLIVVVLLALVVHSLVLSEERYLEAKFGDEWRGYVLRVRRWV